MSRSYQEFRIYRSLGFREKETRSRSVIFALHSEVELHLHEPLTSEETKLYGVRWEKGCSALVHSFEIDALEPLMERIDPTRRTEPLDTPWGTRLLMITDPDGHLLEFRERGAVVSP